MVLARRRARYDDREALPEATRAEILGGAIITLPARRPRDSNRKAHFVVLWAAHSTMTSPSDGCICLALAPSERVPAPAVAVRRRRLSRLGRLGDHHPKLKGAEPAPESRVQAADCVLHPRKQTGPESEDPEPAAH